MPAVGNDTGNRQPCAMQVEKRSPSPMVWSSSLRTTPASSFNPNDKTNLAPYRFLHLAIVITLGARFIPIDAPGLQATIWKPLIKCGQQSLEVFVVGIYLAFIGYFILTTTSDGIFAQLLVGITGIAIMTAVAYYRSWSKRVEKRPGAHAGSPVAGKADGSQPGIRQDRQPLSIIA
jgi:hypothetical protein